MPLILENLNLQLRNEVPFYYTSHLQEYDWWAVDGHLLTVAVCRKDIVAIINVKAHKINSVDW